MLENTKKTLKITLNACKSTINAYKSTNNPKNNLKTQKEPNKDDFSSIPVTIITNVPIIDTSRITITDEEFKKGQVYCLATEHKYVTTGHFHDRVYMLRSIRGRKLVIPLSQYASVKNSVFLLFMTEFTNLVHEQKEKLQVNTSYAFGSMIGSYSVTATSYTHNTINKGYTV
jgi:hypothetical protein